MGLPINQPDFVDAITYAKLRNEVYAMTVPMPGYGRSRICIRYPQRPVSQRGLAERKPLRNHTTNHQLDISFRGGGKKTALLHCSKL